MEKFFTTVAVLTNLYMYKLSVYVCIGVCVCMYVLLFPFTVKASPD